MSDDARSRRLQGPAPGPGTTGSAGGTSTAAPALISVLARNGRLVDQLPHLHQLALDATGGVCALLFEHNPRNGALQATSAFGLDHLPLEPWQPDHQEAAIVSRTFTSAAPMIVADLPRQMPDLGSRLRTPSAILLPVSRADVRVGLVAIGLDTPPDLENRAAADVSDAFLAAIELSRLRRNDELQRDLRDLTDQFAATVSATLNISTGLESFCIGANRLFGADRTSVWVHDRRARQLVLQASSEPEHITRGMRVNSDDPLSPAAASMRQTRADVLVPNEGDATSTLTVPLRGTRRALGAVIFEGVRVEPGGELDLLDRADELGRHLSNSIENMQLLEDILRSRRELENTFDSIADLVVVCDRRGRIVHVNHAFAMRRGLSRELLLDRPMADCVGADLSSWLAEREHGTNGLREPQTRQVNDPVLRGTFIVTVTDLLNHDRERTGSVIVARDLTPQAKLEAEREELRRRLTQTEKLAALGQFIAGIAHELNNPLQGVLGHLELLRVTGAFPKQIRREVQTVYREADRAAKIVRNLLVFAGSRRLTKRSVSVNAIMQKVLALRAGACKAAGIEVVRHYDDKLPRVRIDPLLLHQALLNIVMNAEQAVAAEAKGGRIDVSTALASANRIVVTVRDTGGGIPPEALTRIFEPFYTTKEVGKGTGLGLAIAYGIIQEHGGHIVAANHPDGGAVFTVELPATAARGHVTS